MRRARALDEPHDHLELLVVWRELHLRYGQREYNTRRAPVRLHGVRSDGTICAQIRGRGVV